MTGNVLDMPQKPSGAFPASDLNTKSMADIDSRSSSTGSSGCRMWLTSAIRFEVTMGSRSAALAARSAPLRAFLVEEPSRLDLWMW